MNDRIGSRSRRSTLRIALAWLAAGTALLLASSAFAQARGPIVVLGLRAPDGDDEAAANATNAIRRAARAAGFEVPNDSPALEQSMAAFGCDESVPPECLTQISGDLHAQRMIWGAVRRHGHGREAPLLITVSLYDNGTHQNAGHAEAEVARALAQDSDSLAQTARHLVEQIAPAPAAPPPSSGGPSEGTVGGPAGPPVTTPSQPAPIRRYAGIGGLVLGGAMVVTGAVLGIYWATLINNPDWTGWDNGVDSGTACTHANAAAGTSTAAAAAASVCNTGNAVSAAGWTVGIIGAVLVAGGAALLLTDHSNDTHVDHASLRPRWNFAPVVSPSYSGATLQVQF